LDYTEYEDPTGFKELLGLPADVSDTFTPDTLATPVFTDSAGAVTGLKFPRTGLDSAGRVVLLSFPLDAVPMAGTTNNRVQLLRNILQFLVPGFDGRATLALDQPSYSIPNLVVVQVDDADLAGSGSLSVTFSSTTQSNGAALTLTETARPGTFRGTIELVPATTTNASGTLRALHSDLIQVSYADVSSGVAVHASAKVDTIAPSITGVTADADYEQATISWTTSEPCDSLVQYGESQFLGRTASDPLLTTDHEITLIGLQPDTTNFYQVVSRDIAGNTVVKDNGGVPFALHTLAAVLPPWSDDFNSGATNWSTFDNDGSQSGWTLGVPTNGVQTAAHSPPACWASNRKGESLDYSETFLVSPALQLTGGNSATLSFWHSYDFSDASDSDIFNAGTLYIVTGSGSEATAIAQYMDANIDWELETIDVSAYAGRVVYFVWAYQLSSFDAAPRPGWLVDDVSVTVANVAGGRINITNNLWQAGFVLSGPASQNGKGRFLHLTNAPPGEYVLEFADVLFYNTPSPQTNELASNGTINFIGEYTFSDANSNSIPDPFEAQQFGSVATGRTAITDTDRDGLSDWAEFVAGTDPNNPPPPFLLTARQLANGLVQLSWPSVASHTYRVHTSANLNTWSAYSGWFASAGTNTTHTLPATMNNSPAFFRVEAAPAANSPVAATFQMTATLLINKQVRLEWPSAPGHGYRLHGSTNGTSWSPFTDWMRASGYTMGLTLPTNTNGSPWLFRIEASP
jgi:hypothetical protein